MPYSTLISVGQLQSVMQADPASVVILDCSHDLFDAQAGQRSYAQGHLPGARFVGVDSPQMSGVRTGQNGRHPLPEREEVVDLMRMLGIDDDTQVVVYDSSQGTHAGRVWWTLRWLGHEAVAVLDGGIQVWKAAGGSVTPDVPVVTRHGTFSDRGQKVHPVSFEDVLANVASQTKLVVDARAQDRFRGENETLDPVGGHIPGAVSRFYKLNLKEDGTFKNPEVLASELKEQFGGRPAEDLIMQCGSGVSACHNLLALEVAGLGTAPLYVGSWSEWCTRKEAPIATGD